ncbi:MAG: YitT family protein [Prevotellaceae bacterium]|nr:YitT family protein [Prevotellaceae bacterium]
MSIKSTLKTVKAYIVISVGIFIYAFAWKAFLIPNEITGGGVAGIATVLYFVSGAKISTGITILIVNAILLTVAFYVLGKGFGAKTIYGVVFLSLMFTFLKSPESISGQFNESDKLICAIIGGMLSGVGVVLTFRQGGSTGGTDIVAMILNKYYNTTPGKVFLYCDIVIIGLSYFINHDLRTIIYGYVMMGVFSYTVDLLLSGNKQSVQILIFSRKYKEIADSVVFLKKRGVTALDATGWYTQEATKVLIVLVRKQELNDVYRIIKSIDADALISVAHVMGVFGKGFDIIKTSKKKKYLDFK